MTDQQAALRDMWLQEMWRPVRELPREERDVRRALQDASRVAVGK